MMNTQKENPSTTTANQAPPQPPWLQHPLPRGVRPACAACKYNRKRCKVDCPFAPYFPANMEKEYFHNVHRLFGFKNVIKILNMVQEDLRDDAMNSIIYEANVRAAIPAGGCASAIVAILAHIAHCENELQLVAECIVVASAAANAGLPADSSGDAIVDQTP